MQGLPIAQYPEIVPPMVQVTTTFIGASATDVEASVATPLEQKINGVEKGIYMKSTNANDGTLTLKVSFEVGSNQDMDNVFTQNRVSEAMPQMPQSVKNYGVTVKKALPFPLLVISVKSPNGHLRQQLPLELHDDQHQRRDRAHSGRRADQPVRRQRLRDADLAAPGSHRTPRHHDPGHRQRDQPAEPADARPARSAARRPRPAPSTPTRSSTQGRLLDEQEFGNIILRTNPDGSEVRLKDVARIELGTMLYNAVGRHDGKPAAVIAVFQIPGTNARRGRQQHQGDDGRPEEAFSARHGLPGVARHDAAGHRGDQRDRPHAASKRSRSSSSSCSSSCRTGARR